MSSPEDVHVPTNQQRREAERRRLQRQLEERRAREAARKRRTLILSIVGTIVLIAVIVVVVVVVTSGNGNKNNTAAGANSQTSPATTPTPATPTPTTTTTPPPVTTPTAPCAAPPKGTKASFQGVTVTGAKDLAHAPTVKSLSQKAPTTVHCMDVVVGKGKPATPTSTVKVQYAGVLYKNGSVFDSSWSRGQPASFSLTGVIKGFTQGIGGAGKVAPMRVGGRRIMIIPAALAYGANPPSASIPANAPLVFVVDLKSVTG